MQYPMMLLLTTSIWGLDFTTKNIYLAPAQALDSRKIEADKHLAAARFQLQESSLLGAKTKFQQAIKLYQDLNDTEGQVNCWVGLAWVDYSLGNYRGAQDKLRTGVRLGDNRNGRLLSLRGLISLELGDYRGALGDLRTGVHYLQVSGDRDRLGMKTLNETRIALGEVYGYLGQYQQASNTLHSAVSATTDLHLKRRALNALATINLEIGQYRQALNIYQQALNLPNTSGDRIGKAKVLSNLGRAYRAVDDQKQALKQYQLALDEFRAIGAWSQQVFVLNHLGRLALDLGLTNRALEYLTEAKGRLSSTGGVGRVVTLNNLGYYYFQKQDYDRATNYLEQALAWATKNGDSIGKAKALSSLGEIKLRSENYPEAEAALSSSLDVFESLRPGLRDEEKIALFETQSYTYDLLQQVYVKSDRPDEALAAAERGRARAFIELLAQRMSFKANLEAQINPPNLDEIKAVAQKRKATLVTYSIIRDRIGRESNLYIWVVNPQGKITLRPLDLAAIEATYKTSLASISKNARQAASGGLDLRKPRLEDFVASFRGELVSPDPLLRRRIFSFPRDAYKLLIEPIADLLPENSEEKVIFIPQQELFLVPFAALQSPEGKFLIEQHTLQIAPSIQTLALKKSSPTFNTESALIVGNPAPMPELLLPLPGAETEAKTIAEILDTSVLLGQEATETAVIERMADAKLIHLATHGLFDEQQGLQSSLAFATTESETGLLTAEEILDLELNADLVVLSACNTGRGSITGDGVVGLSRSFLLAGASNTLVSLWYIDDESTANLMTEFYRNLQDNPDKAQSLRQAMMTMMKENPHPRHWAGFVLVGQ